MALDTQIYNKLKSDFSVNPETDQNIQQLRSYGQQAGKSAGDIASANLAQKGFGNSTYAPGIQAQAGAVAAQPYAQAELDYLSKSKDRELSASLGGIQADVNMSQLDQQAYQFEQTMEQENTQWAQKLGLEQDQFQELIRQFDINNQREIDQFADEMGLRRDELTEVIRNNKALEKLKADQINRESRDKNSANFWNSAIGIADLVF